jgi:hypothetical protein
MKFGHSAHPDLFGQLLHELLDKIMTGTQ